MTGMVQTDLAHPSTSKYKDEPADDHVSGAVLFLFLLSFFLVFFFLFFFFSFFFLESYWICSESHSKHHFHSRTTQLFYMVYQERLGYKLDPGLLGLYSRIVVSSTTYLPCHDHAESSIHGYACL